MSDDHLMEEWNNKGFTQTFEKEDTKKLEDSKWWNELWNDVLHRVNE